MTATVDTGSTTNTWAPVTILPGDVTIVDVEASEAASPVNSFSLVLDDTGQIWAWGSNGYGALGDGGTDLTPAEPVTPVQVDLGPGIVATSISAGGFHAMALDQFGRAWAWGFNGSGQLGIPNTGTGTFTSVLPSMVPGFANLQQAEAAEQHSQLLDADGQVWGFGYSYRGCAGHRRRVERLDAVNRRARRCDHRRDLRRRLLHRRPRQHRLGMDVGKRCQLPRAGTRPVARHHPGQLVFDDGTGTSTS